MTNGRLQLVFSRDVRRLLEAAADGFLCPSKATPENPFPTPNYLLALRQGGLRDDLIRLAARRGCKGWFDPPLCIFHELPSWLGAPDSRPLSDVERHALLRLVPVGANGFEQLSQRVGAVDRHDPIAQRVAWRVERDRQAGSDLLPPACGSPAPGRTY